MDIVKGSCRGEKIKAGHGLQQSYYQGTEHSQNLVEYGLHIVGYVVWLLCNSCREHNDDVSPLMTAADQSLWNRALTTTN